MNVTEKTISVAVFYALETLIYRISFQDVLFQDSCCPSAKRCASLRFYAIADRNYHVKAVCFHRFIGVCNVQKMHIAFFVKFPLAEDVVYVFRYDRPFGVLFACPTLRP